MYLSHTITSLIKNIDPTELDCNDPTRDELTATACYMSRLMREPNSCPLVKADAEAALHEVLDYLAATKESPKTH